MAKGDRWSDDPNVQVREMRNAETVSGVIREREFPAKTTGELIDAETVTLSSEGGGRKRSRSRLTVTADANGRINEPRHKPRTSPAAYPDMVGPVKPTPSPFSPTRSWGGDGL